MNKIRTILLLTILLGFTLWIIVRTINSTLIAPKIFSSLSYPNATNVSPLSDCKGDFFCEYNKSVIIDTQDTTQQVFAYYEKRLLSEGWKQTLFDKNSIQTERIQDNKIYKIQFKKQIFFHSYEIDITSIASSLMPQILIVGVYE